MTTKELIQAEIDALDEQSLAELYPMIKNFAESKRQNGGPGLMSRLRRIAIEAPEDFAENFDLYRTGEKHAD